MKKAICILTCEKIDELDLDMLNNFRNYKVHIFYDYCDPSKSKGIKRNTDYNRKEADFEQLKLNYPNITFLRNSEEEKQQCMNEGFRNLSLDFSECTAWDQSVHYFSKQNFDRVWILEQDVFFYNETTFESIDLGHPDHDFLAHFHSKSSEIKGQQLKEWFWPAITPKIKNMEEPFYSCMCCVIRLSKTFIQKITDYATEHKHLFMLEAFFPTMAIKHNLKITDYIMDEFQHIWFSKIFTEDKDNIDLSRFTPSRFQHAIKDFKLHKTIRKIIDMKDNEALHWYCFNVNNTDFVKLADCDAFKDFA